MEIKFFRDENEVTTKLSGFNIRFVVEQKLDGGRVPIVGWLLGKTAPVVSLVLREVAGKSEVFKVPVEIERPDILALCPNIGYAGHCGFAISQYPENDFELVAVFENGDRVKVAVVHFGSVVKEPKGGRLQNASIASSVEGESKPAPIKSKGSFKSKKGNTKK